MKEGSINVYVIHSKFLNNRVNMFEGFLNTIKSLVGKVEIINEKDPAEIIPPDVSQFTNQPVQEEDLKYFNSVLRPLKAAQVSNCIKHKIALQKIADSKSFYNLVIEDDIMFVQNIKEKIKEIIKAIKETPGIYFCGLPSPSDTPVATVKNAMDFYKLIPACDSYFIDPATAKTILSEYDKIRFANNVQLQYTCVKNKLNINLISPNCFVDGSKLGAVTTTIELNNRLIFNPLYMTILDHINKDELDHKLIGDMMNRFEFKENPEYHYLKAKYEVKKKNYKIAMGLFKQSFSMYKMAGVPLTQGSEFMKDYMKLHREFQD